MCRLGASHRTDGARHSAWKAGSVSSTSTAAMPSRSPIRRTSSGRSPGRRPGNGSPTRGNTAARRWSHWSAPTGPIGTRSPRMTPPTKLRMACGRPTVSTSSSSGATDGQRDLWIMDLEGTLDRPGDARAVELRTYSWALRRPSSRDTWRRGRLRRAARDCGQGLAGDRGTLSPWPLPRRPPIRSRRSAPPSGPGSRARSRRPTQAQAEGWAAIASGRHTLIHAPTGSGKTLAAFLWTLDRLAAPPPRPPAAKGQPGSRPRPVHQPAQGADLRRRAQPPGAARRDRPRGRPPRRARPRHHGREPHRRHAGRGPPRTSPAARRTS